MSREARLIKIIMLCQDVLTNDVEVQEAVTGGSVSEVNSASEGEMRVLICPDVNMII